MIGIAFETLDNAENIGYIIPVSDLLFNSFPFQTTTCLVLSVCARMGGEHKVHVLSVLVLLALTAS